MTRSGALAAFLVALASGCGHDAAPTATTLAGDAVARVDDAVVLGESVLRVGAAQHVPPAQARDALVADALLAVGARHAGVDRAPDVELATGAILTRRLLYRLKAEAAAKGPPTDAEIAPILKARWADLDRPESFRTVHAFVQLGASTDEATRARAREVIEAMRTAALAVAAELRSTPTPSPPGAVWAPWQPDADPLAKAFLERAAAVAKGAVGVKLEAEVLPPVTADARVVMPEEMRFDPAFAEAAAALGERGDVSGLVTSSLGVHVALLLQRIPAEVHTRDELRRMPDIVATTTMVRAGAAKEQLLARLRPQASVERSADALLEQVRVLP